MGKLQPNFSWQKYEGKPEDEREQFQHQLQRMHIVIANTTNATIDDVSFFAKERQTSFTWLDNKPIYTKTFTATLTIAGVNNIAHGITGIKTVIGLFGSAQDAATGFSKAIPLPYVDTSSVSNQISLSVDPTNIVITLGNTTWQNYLAEVTIQYTKV